MRILIVAGTRPNFMKVAPIIRALQRRSVQYEFVHTGQHYDPAMSEVFFADLGLPKPDHHLGVGSGSYAHHFGQVMSGIEALLSTSTFTDILVVGDVNSTAAAAMIGAQNQVRVSHVEAGLRSGDRRMPEEINRLATDAVSDLLFAPSPDAVDNLRAEGVPDEKVHFVGNVMIDSLMTALPMVDRSRVLEELGLTRGGYALVTLHRPSNVDDTSSLARLGEALRHVSERIPVILPVHPRARSGVTALGFDSFITLLDPVGYIDFLALQRAARIVLTDSGGVQEETTMFKVPCLTLRENTERPVTVEFGTNQIVGTDPAAVIKAAEALLDADGVESRVPPLWDGNAANRIVNVLITD